VSTTARTATIALVAALAAVPACLYAKHLPQQVLTTELGSIWRFPAWTVWSWNDHPGFLYLFSGAQGWIDEDAAIAAQYARSGYEVIGIDVNEYLQHLDHAGTGCIYLPGPLEKFSRTNCRRARVC
jgi:type IV secretory pathway VirJ component